jgi:hypothetical protein
MKKALLEYFVAKNKTFLFVIRSDVDGPPLVKEIPYGTEFWARQRSEFYRAVLFANPYRTRAFEREISEFYDLGEILLKPALSHLSGVQMLYIVPHGDLHYLPFHGMRIPTADGDRLAITEFQIVYLPSASVLRFCQQKNPARQGGTKVNNPLVLGTWAANDPDAFRSAICAETQELATLFKARPLMGLEASKPSFLAQAPRADLLHLACHGSFITSPDTMSTTGLLLNNGRVFPTAAYSDGPHPRTLLQRGTVHFAHALAGECRIEKAIYRRLLSCLARRYGSG